MKISFIIGCFLVSQFILSLCAFKKIIFLQHFILFLIPNTDFKKPKVSVLYHDIQVLTLLSYNNIHFQEIFFKKIYSSICLECKKNMKYIRIHFFRFAK